mmetsp:Transcript_3098/g.3785  ORF Transcript_3098/g.3785 Transcript_3098/m.3785 type:complete len:82 (-) Transcript_3098:1-246(-)
MRQRAAAEPKVSGSMTSSSAEGTEEATQYTGEKLVAGNDFFANFSSVFLVIAIAALLIALYVFREQWLPFLYERTVGWQGA